MIISKSKLAILLSKLRVFEAPKLKSEQYTTDSEIAADVLWQAYYLKDIENKTTLIKIDGQEGFIIQCY